MIKAFVFVEVRTGTEKDLIDGLFEIPEVLEAHMIVGDFDLLIVVGAKEEDLIRFPAGKIVEVLTDRIRKMENVLDTKTIIPVFSEIKKSHLTDLDTLARGFVCLKVKLGMEKHVMHELLKIENIVETHLVTGTYDVIAVLEVKKTLLPPHYPELIADIVTEKIGKIKEVQDTETIIPDFSKIRS